MFAGVLMKNVAHSSVFKALSLTKMFSITDKVVF